MASQLPIYETTLNILREAGFVLKVVDENVSASINGATIRTAYANYVSTDAAKGTAVAEASDLTVTVDGKEAEISGIDAEAGKITLKTAPKSGATILVSYHYSPVTLDFVETVRDDAECAINSKMKAVDPCAPYAVDSAPYCVRMMTRLWAAGLLLARDYGYNQDIELTSKDGYRKIEEAKSLLEDFYASGGSCGSDSDSQVENSGGTRAVVTESGGDMFRKPGSHCRDEGDLEFNIC